MKNKKDFNEKKAVIFDSGALISFSMNGITDLIRKLKSVFNGKFLITSEVKNESIDVPLKIKRFELEALKIRQLLDEGVLELPLSLGISDAEISQKTSEILEITNSSFVGKEREIKIMDKGESSCFALGKILNERNINNIIVIDERTARILVENPDGLKNFLEKKLHTKVFMKKEKLNSFKNFRIIRSAEVVYVAYKKGLVDIKDKNVLDALLYAVKFKGASISGEEIEEIKRIDVKN